MYLKAKCKKCGKSGFFDIGKHTIKEAKELLSNQQFGECQFGGWHVEIGVMTDFLIIDESKLYKEAK